MDYIFAKLIHIVAMILWIGPPLGAYYIVYQTHRTGDPERLVWAERLAERVLRIEHVAFVFLIGSGVYILYCTGWGFLSLPWLRKKLMLFGGVLLFELFDIWVSHWALKKVLEAPEPHLHPDWPRAERLRFWLAALGVPVGTILIPGILYFAIAKS